MKLILFLFFLPNLLLLSACDQFSRFQQEKYECRGNSSGIDEILFDTFKIGGDVKIIIHSQEIKSQIIDIDSDYIKFNINKKSILINRKTNSLTVKSQNEITLIQCKKTNFKM